MFRIGLLITVFIASFYLITACTSQPETIIQTVIVEITLTPLTSNPPTDTQNPEPTDTPVPPPTNTPKPEPTQKPTETEQLNTLKEIQDEFVK